MAAQTVHFMNGSSKSLAQGLLTKLFKGQSRFSILPYDTTKQATGTYEGGIDWADLSFSGADEVFTLKDSFTLSKADDTEENIQIDQLKGATIDTEITERGSMTFEGNIPVICEEWANIFYDAGASIAHSNPVLGQNATEYNGKAYFLESKQVECVCLIENDNEDRAIAFARVSMRLSPQFESGSPAYYKMSATVLTNTDKAGTQGDYAIFHKYSAS